MSAAELDNPAFQDDDLAREWFEAQIWPKGAVCPHCGATGEGQVTRMFGKKHRTGCFQCNGCRGQFTVTTGTVMERSHIGLHLIITPSGRCKPEARTFATTLWRDIMV